MAKDKLVMVQGFDRYHKEFTAFILCNEQQSKQIENAKLGLVESLNLNELNIIYKTSGHNVDAQAQHDIQEYYQHIIGEIPD